ncbi:MAG: EAL domain-containing protein [Lachnospiraceae bacterium]|nr:EAL domain-containing protein [Lachnospiraceae bacterium]
MGNPEKPVGNALYAYITENIDRAIEEGWITAYYQPVARTITGEICGMEALARWVDPVYGLFAPNDFISVLEDAQLIHKLDCAIIQRICKDYSRSMREDDHTVTVSFNLSRLDFRLCDIHSFIEEEIKKNKVPRDALRVEITESMMENDDRMHDVIDRFWDRGFRVWMDDFGSGYSSLNVLKDYRFDTLKIDMVFLRNFNARSKEIIKSVVDMSKRIGVHTLAEGVETAEQFEFLRSIGCEKAQGYYIGKPMPYEEYREYLKNRGFSVEASDKRQYYHDIGRVNVLSATPFMSVPDNNTDTETHDGQIPIAFVEYAEGKLKYLFCNDSYKKTLAQLGVDSIEDVEREFEEGRTQLREKFLAMLLKAQSTDTVVGNDFMRGNKLCYAQVRTIAGYPGGNAFLCILQNLSDNSVYSKSSFLSGYLQSLCTIYEFILLLDLNTGYSRSLYHSAQTIKEYHRRPAVEELKDYAHDEIHPEDRERYLEFTNLDTIEERVAKSPTRHISAAFRTRVEDGKYVWCLYSFLFAGDKSERKLLSCFRKLSPEAIDRLQSEMSQ